MNKKTAAELLTLQGAPLGERTRFCPDDETIAAWFEARLENVRQESLRGHLADCGYCRGRLGMLARLRNDDPLPRVASDVIAGAKRLASGTARTRRWAPAWAAAAVAAIAFGVLTFQSVMLNPPPVAVEGEAPQVRGIEVDVAAPRILSPAADSVVEPGALEFRWSPVAGSLYYELFVLSDAGDLLVHERVDDTRWRAPSALGLEPGAEYYVHVEARFQDDGKADSGHSPFRVGDGQ